MSNLSLWRRHLVNAYEVEAGIGVIGSASGVFRHNLSICIVAVFVVQVDA